MSAREWYICPFCKKDTTKAKEEYGKIPVDKFIKKYKDSLIKEYNEEEEEETESVRMDGEEWLDDDGTYKVDHNLSCNNCGREWEIKVKVYPTDESHKGRKLTFKTPSKSGGEDHEVEIDKDVWKCDCVSFKTRKRCSHIDKIKKQLEEKNNEIK